ncbi:MAG: YggT family protein [Candidatus Omnitrophica bacterium]|nr:YggT family protein [Candidatus Omnitrophota bacterium]MBU1047188.1 YggT family protein [Candidatus Omnitrophota bacterium]MBU1630260.1 YggT family protein [Candidatus Omnitrophota bacterium]MBU1889488.1 YggT family protein [Candidatus Omnitrophota bacterium]
MFIFSNFLIAFADVLGLVLTIAYWLILIRVLISWVNPDPYNPIVQFLYKATEPILAPIRKLLPFSLKFSIDISPIIAFLIIWFLKIFLVQTFIDLALKLK